MVQSGLAIGKKDFSGYISMRIWIASPMLIYTIIQKDFPATGIIRYSESVTNLSFHPNADSIVITEKQTEWIHMQNGINYLIRCQVICGCTKVRMVMSGVFPDDL